MSKTYCKKAPKDRDITPRFQCRKCKRFAEKKKKLCQPGKI